MIKVFVVVLGLAATAAGGLIYWQHTRDSVVVDPTFAGTTTVTRGSVTQSVSSTGTVASNLDVPIKCRASGEVTQIGPKDRTKLFDVGDTVKKDNLLMEVDPTDEDRAILQADAEVAISAARLEE